MNVTILAPGSRGDIQPYIALGQALRTLGHACTLVTTADHEALVRGYGLEPATIPIHIAAELQRVETQRAVEGGGTLASFRQFAEIARRAARATVEVSSAAARGCDVLVTNFSTALVAGAISSQTGVPLVQAYNVPLTATSAFPGALFPRLDFGALSRRLGHRLTRTALWMTNRMAANDACVELLGARPAPRFPPAHAGLLPGPVLYGFSEQLLPRPADWPADVEVTGFWSVAEASDFTPPAELARFLDEGPPPVCVGFGSMSTEKPQEVSALVVRAARAAKVRLVLLSGWANLDAELRSPEVMTAADVPHTWLYPRCRAVVHHGGAGTTAAAVRAGVPALVVPFHGDQPFWASRVQRLGLGPPPIPRRRLTAERLAAGISAAMTDDALRSRAAEVGRAVQSEQGAMRAAERLVRAAR